MIIKKLLNEDDSTCGASNAFFDIGEEDFKTQQLSFHANKG